jgi:hypothetical protein
MGRKSVVLSCYSVITLVNVLSLGCCTGAPPCYNVEYLEIVLLPRINRKLNFYVVHTSKLPIWVITHNIFKYEQFFLNKDSCFI